MKVPLCEKSKDVIEPPTKPQWWCRMDGMAVMAIEAVRDGKVKIQSETIEKIFFRWLENT